jgi:hypothetical protein
LPGDGLVVSQPEECAIFIFHITRDATTLENLALRQQLALLRRQSKRAQFGRLDRLLWI